MRVPTMRAVRRDADGVHLDEVRRVRPGAGQVLVRVGAIALDRRDSEPTVGPRTLRGDAHGLRVLGRHVAGTVAAPGAGADGWPLGRRVALQPEVRVGRVWFVPGTEQDGGLADYVVVPVEGLVQIPQDLPIAVGAVLPLAARAHSMLVHAGVTMGASVGIWGAGSLGGVAVPIARLLGAVPLIVVDPSAAARETALEHGADVTLDPADATFHERLSAITGGHGLDVVIHAAPDADAGRQAVAALGQEGRGILAGPFTESQLGDRWDGRTLSGPPRVHPESLPLLARLAHLGRLRLTAPAGLAGGLDVSADLLTKAVQGGAPLSPHVVTPGGELST